MTMPSINGDSFFCFGGKEERDPTSLKTTASRCVLREKKEKKKGEGGESGGLAYFFL